MAIIVKYILKSISEKKFRTFIILFSVTLSAALFFASSGMSGTMTSMYEKLYRMQIGKADLIIYPDEESPAYSFKINSPQMEGVSMVAGEVSTLGQYKSNRLSENLYIRGFDLEELDLFNPINFQQQATGQGFEGNYIILSSIFSQEHGFDVGDSIDIDINGQERILTVWGIAKPTGIFQHSPQSDNITALMPKDKLSSLLGIRGRVQTAYVVLEDGANVHEIKEDLSSLYSRYRVEEPFSMEELEANMQTIAVPLFLMTMMVLFISIFIIYSTFKVITVERLPVLGTFRSIGATKGMTNLVLIGESLTYGILGGIFGNLLGIGILYLITAMMAADPYAGQMEVAIRYNPSHLITSFILAVVVALLSSWLPIRKASKIPIKDLVLNRVEKREKKNLNRRIMPAILLILAMILPRIAPRPLALVVNVLSFLIISIAVIILIPHITRFQLRFIERFYGCIFGNEGILAVKNLKQEKNILNSIALLAIGISTILMINTISHSIAIEVFDAYKDYKFQIMTSINFADRNVEQMLRSVEGVEGTYGSYESWNGVQVKDSPYRISYLQGIDINKYRDYVTFRMVDKIDEDATFANLDKGRNIMITNMVKDSLGIEVGDKISLEMPAGDKDYMVIGLFDSLMSNGSNAIISQRHYKMDMKENHISQFYVKTSEDPDRVLLSIEDKFARRGIWADTISNMERMNTESNNQFMIILQAFSLIAMLIGIFGIFNNYMISFIERKRSIAILRSIGLSKRQTLKMLMIEALTGGYMGGIVGIFAGILMLSTVPYLMQSISIPIGVHFKLSFIINSLVGGIIIAVVGSISPALKTSKLNIIEAIKYE